MANLNNCSFIGNVGQAPSIKTFQSGEKVATFSLAVTEKYNDRNGNRQEKTEWINLVVNGKMVEVVEKYISKGTQLYLSGKLTTRKYTNTNNEEKTITEIRVRDIVLLGSKPEGDQQAAGGNSGKPNNQAVPAAPAAPAAAPAPADASDDLPF